MTQTLKELKEIFSDRIQFDFGKSLIEFTPSEFDIHVYPVDYGNKFPFIESVATNCLEMALIGIPSLVTRGGAGNWPELVSAGLVYEVDWEDSLTILNAIKTIQDQDFSRDSSQNFRLAIDIQTNLSNHLKYII